MLSRLGLRVHSAARNVAGPLTNQFREYKINADEIKVGFLLEWEGKKMSVLSYKAAMMGRRPTSLHIEMRDTATGKVYPVRFNPSDRVERMVVDHIPYNFLYIEGNIAYAMHPETFEQIEFDLSYLGEQRAAYLQPDSQIDIAFHNNAIFSIQTPEFAVMQVTEVPMTDSNLNTQEYKSVKISNGRTVKVPQFINEGDKIKIRVSDESFHSRE